jgi:3,5-epimerase/4-reductase
MHKIFIFGSKGYFGSHFVQFFQEKGWEVIGYRVDVSDYNKVKEALSSAKPDVILNCAGKTGKPNVDWCEDNKVETMKVNVQGALNIACACKELGLYLAHIGSGCIYEGDNGGKGFGEEDAPNFYGSFYSRTKIYSEQALKEFNPLQLRVRIPIEGKPGSKNVIDKLLKYKKIISIENSFTIVEDFLHASYELIQKRERGVFNMTNVGSMDHKYLMEQYQKIVDPQKSFEFMSLEDLKNITKAPRSNCTLDTTKREALGISMPSIKERIPEIMEEYVLSL